MKPLDATESWDLFMRKAFGGNTSIYRCPKELKKIGNEILKKCSGLPLAICVVGSLLAKRIRSKSEWEKVLKELNSHLIGSYGDLNNIAAILELSYHNLPLEVKACFLCLGFFKEDATLKAKELVHLWVAQGLVAREVEGEGVRMEEVARDYLNELISRNMVQVTKMEYDRVRDCKMHDLLRDLSVRIEKEEMDFEVIRESGNSHQYSLAKPRHRAIYCSKRTFLYSINRNQCLRSLFIHPEDHIYVSDGGPSSYWKSFELFKGISVLIGLRYFRMRCNGQALRLPSSWAKLKNLEVLVLRGSHCGLDIDKTILKMVSLRHLYAFVNSCEVGLGNMRDLQTLYFLHMKNCSDVWKIEGMRGVSKLGIDVYKMRETSSLFTCLSSLENLSHLTLSRFSPSTDFEGLTSLHRVTQLKLHRSLTERVAVPVYCPPNLTHMTLSNLSLEEDPMPVLQKLPDLLYLKLDGVYISRVMVITSGGFPSLGVLRITNMSTWGCKIEVEESAMPDLDQFIIGKGWELGVGNLPERISSAIASVSLNNTPSVSTYSWNWQQFMFFSPQQVCLFHNSTSPPPVYTSVEGCANLEGRPAVQLTPLGLPKSTFKYVVS